MQVGVSSLDPLKTCVKAGFYTVGFLAAGFSAYSYFRNWKRERSRWLFDLYRRFHETPDLSSCALRELGQDRRLRTYPRQFDYEHLAELLEDFGHAGTRAGAT